MAEPCPTRLTLPIEFRAKTAADVLALLNEQLETLRQDDSLGSIERAKAVGYLAERLGIAAEFLDTFGDCIALRLTEARLHDNTPSANAVRERLSEFSELGETIKLATADSIAAGWWRMFAALSD